MKEERKKGIGEESISLSGQNLVEELVALIRSPRPVADLRQALADYHDSDLADVLEQSSPAERKRLYRLLGADRTSDVFAYLEDVGRYLEELDTESAADVIQGMDAADAVDALEELESSKRRELLDLMDADVLEDIRLIHSYDDDLIGSRMTTNYVAIDRTLTIKQAMRSLIRQAAENDNISTLYALNEDGTFYGAIDLKDLIIARVDGALESLIVTSYPRVYSHDRIEDHLERLRDYSEDSIPVLGEDDRLLGVITAQDVVEVVDEALGEDYARLAGLTAEEDLAEPLRMSVRKRVPWLVVLLFLGFGVSAVVGLFEQVVSSLTVIVCFQSLILSMAGNVGTQSLAVTVRVLMEGELPARQQWSLLLKELRVGFCNGAVLGVASTGLIGLYIWLFQGQAAAFAFATSGCIGAAMLAAMTVSSLTGTAIPMLFKKLRVDPAVASGPLITTVNDLVAVVAYYGLAWLLLLNR